MGRTFRRRRKADQMRPANEFAGSLSAQPENVALVKCLKSTGWQNDNRLEPARFRSTGRGVFSKQPIDPSSPLIEMPFESLITMATLEKDEQFKAMLQPGAKQLEKKIPTQCLFALYILWRRHQNPSDPYVRSIPAEFSHPFFCNKHELMVLPDNLFERVHEQSQQISQSLALFTSAIGTQLCPCCSAPYVPDIFTTTSFKWAFYAVNSRSVFIETANVKRICTSTDLYPMLRDSPNIALAPFLDLLNHSDRITPSEPEFFVPRGCKSTSELTYKLPTTHSFRAYDQIFISYGPLDNTKLLLEYGFVLAQNAHDCVRFSMVDVNAFLAATAKTRKPINSNKFKFIKENRLDAELFISRADGFSHSMMVVLTILFVEVAHFNNVLSIVGFGDVQPLEPVADVARQLLAFKRHELEAAVVAIEKQAAGGVERRSASGRMVLDYLAECVSLIDDVVSSFLDK